MDPPWKDRFVEGQRDLLHGGTLSKAVVQSANLKQCSRLVQGYRISQLFQASRIGTCNNISQENFWWMGSSLHAQLQLMHTFTGKIFKDR